MTTTRTNLVLKTVTVGNVTTLLAPADRIGSAETVVALRMAGDNSPRQLFTPQLPTRGPKPGGSATGADGRHASRRLAYPWPAPALPLVDRDCQSPDQRPVDASHPRSVRSRTERKRTRGQGRTAGQ
jgi:hypothetical protein